MKLQPKQQVINEIAIQQKSQIDEGIRIARKVDALRETLASLELQHKTFLASSRVELEKHNKDLEENKQKLLSEIQQLEDRRIILLKPLDDEWAKVEEEKQEIERLKIIQSNSQQSLNDNWEILKRDTEKLNKRELVIQNKEEAIERVTHETLELNEKAKILKETKAREYDEFTKTVKEKTKELDKREKLLITQADLNEHNKNILDKREKDLIDKERFINDKYDTLMRTINRINK